MPAVSDVRSTPPLPWWSQAWRLAAALVLGLTFWSIQAGDTSENFTSTAPRVIGLIGLDLLVGLFCLALIPWRRRLPRTVAAVTGLAGIVSIMSTGPWLVAAVSLSTRRRPVDIVLLAFTSLAASFGFEALVSSSAPIPAWLTLVVSWLIVLVCAANGWYIGARRDLLASLQERAETAEREQSARVAEARARERTTIAREMHDILAHRISLVAMHAGALTYRTDLTAEQSTATARVIESNAHLALSDLRDVLGVLRSPESVSAARRPQPSWSDLPGLLHEARQAGMQIVATDSTTAAPPLTIARHAYRVVQESLTNVRKHAPGGVTRLDIDGRPGSDLVVTIANPAPRRRDVGAARLPGAGLGLAGLAERAELAGGTLTHGPTAHGSFEVRATFPWPPEPADSPLAQREAGLPGPVDVRGDGGVAEAVAPGASRSTGGSPVPVGRAPSTDRDSLRHTAWSVDPAPYEPTR